MDFKIYSGLGVVRFLGLCAHFQSHYAMSVCLRYLGSSIVFDCYLIHPRCLHLQSGSIFISRLHMNDNAFSMASRLTGTAISAQHLNQGLQI